MLIGREYEKKRLKSAVESENSEFVAVYGRRRVGKTFLIKETFAGKFAFYHSGLAKGELQQQLEEFSKSLTRCKLCKHAKFKTWSDAFFALENGLEELPHGKKIIFLDELPWMDTRRSNFVSALEHFWNGWCAMRTDIVLIVCGSATSWIVSKIARDHGGLHNRLTDQIHLLPFTLDECEQFVRAKKLPLSREQIVDGYMVLGGIPFYWDRLDRSQSIDQNIDRLFFGPGAPLGDEYDQLYASLFKHPEGHLAVVKALGLKKCGMTRREILACTHLDDGGCLSHVLQDLESCEFIRSYTPPQKRIRDTVYQLVDLFTLFYFKFMAAGRNRTPGGWLDAAFTQERRIWNGLAFERVAFWHLPQICQALGISGIRTTAHAWRRDGEDGVAGAQIDMLIARADHAVNICEMKYSSEPYEITAEEDRKLTHRKLAFVEGERFRGSVFMTLVTMHGVKHNAYWNNIQSEVTMEDLFRPLTIH